MNAKTKLAYSYVRFSTDKQTWGDSERRQEQAAKDYCARKGLKLAEASFADRGVSGWKGKNRQTGAFAKLLTVANPGDYIIIEDNDRFSREKVRIVLNGLWDVVERGVTVVFLKTGVEVTKENFDEASVLFPNFFQSHLANQESEKKSQRVGDAWMAKRSRISTEKLTANCVSWLSPVYGTNESGERVCTGFKPIPEHVKVMRQIFQWAASGIGYNTIAVKLNQQNVKPFEHGKKWHPNSVKRILCNRAVIGEFTPGTIRKGEARKLLEPIPDYYPEVISRELFATACKLIDARKNGKGYGGRTKFNVFSHLAYDRATGSAMTYINKSKGGERKYHYLVARDELLGVNGAKQHWWQYDEFLAAFLMVTQQAALQPKPKLEVGDGKLDLAKMELDDTQKQIDRLIDLHAKGISSSVETKLRALEETKSKLIAQIKDLESEAIAKPADLSKIDWTDRDALRDNLRATVKRITVDAGSKSFDAEFLDGRRYGLEVKDGLAQISLPGTDAELSAFAGNLNEAAGKVRKAKRK